MAQELSNLRVKRGHFKTALTNFKKYCENINSDQLDDSIVTQLEARLEKILPLYDNFYDVQLQIKTLNSNEESENANEDSDLEVFENNYFDLTSRAKGLISKHRDSKTLNQIQNNGASVAMNDSNQGNIRLPTINLPTFSGSYDHWQEFHDSFNALIHENKSLSDIQKFYYLKSSIKNEAAQTIQSIEVSSTNYYVAWDLLRERFQNKRLIIHSYVKALFELPQLNKESHIGLRQLLDTATKNIRSLTNIGEPTEHWDTLLIYIIVSKLDHTTRREWESFETASNLPVMTDLNKFLKNKCQILETLKSNKLEPNCLIAKQKRDYHTNVLVTTNQNLCIFCKSSHSIYLCEEFLKLSVNDRIQEVRKLQLCHNCLRKGHYTRDCRAILCRRCNRKHHTLLHIDNFRASNLADSSNTQINSHSESQPLSSRETPGASSSNNTQQTLVANHSSSLQRNNVSQVLLSTVCLKVKDSEGQFHDCRALLDSGAQSNFMTEEFCNRLNLRKSKLNMAITGISQSNFNINHMTHVQVFAQHGGYQTSLTCLILLKITEPLPTTSFDKNRLNIPPNIRLADPSFNISNKIDMLIGSSIFYNLLAVGQIELGKGLPTLQKTLLGWVVAGPLNYLSQSLLARNYLTVESKNSLDNQVAKFWCLEECNNNFSGLSQEEKQCEEYFKQTIKRDPTGRFIVKIPFKENVSLLGDSREVALKRFYNLERRFRKDQNLKQNYVDFIEEYKHLNHMSAITDNKKDSGSKFYLPHHAVIRESSLTTKIRVVFDGSAKTTTGVSLNETQLIGPAIQNDLFEILIRFRKHTIVLGADITKMYRQILVDPDDRRYQTIIFRRDENETLQFFELNTVTYGTSSAPFLAIRCLHQLALECQANNPTISSIIRNDFYVDDLLTGSDSVEEITQIYQKLTNILNSAGFELRKWVSNNSNVLENIKNHSNTGTNILHICDKEETKTLGIIWNSTVDTFQYEVKLFNKENRVSKRTILSITAQIFDPLGLLSPVTIIAKTIIQKLWQHQLSWDESIPIELHTKWIRFQDELQILNSLRIQRHIVCENPVRVELHGFSDASEIGYGAAIYIRSINASQIHTVNLLCSKSRVAPLRNTTLPRLELCAAVLLANLVHKVRNCIKMKFTEFRYWCDSTITLHWIKSPPNRWKTFIANRVAEIQNYTNTDDWHHIQTGDNPADIISRGAAPHELINSQLWWHGPVWLKKDQAEWPIEHFKLISENKNLEIRKTTCLVNTYSNFDLFSKYSNLFKLKKIFAYCLRFIHNTKHNREQRITGECSVMELENSLLTLIRIAQRQYYEPEFNNLENKKAVDSRSKLLSLNPFLDDLKLIRVGGRLQNSNFNYNKKCPIILPTKHPLTIMIIRNEHEKLLHCGTQSLLASLRDRFWPPSARSTIKGVIRQCVKCFRVNPTNVPYLMGNLPKGRVEPNPPFYNCGVDYAGPFLIKDKRTRGAKLVKAYISLFVCFSTKAIHLELVSDLTTETFIAAMRRFISRRGKPQNMYSDNGSNLQGADTEIKKLSEFLASNSMQRAVINSMSRENITWHFIPPRAPHFGGLWEAGVKSTKSHLKRVLSNAHLVFEDFYTVLTQIESILNSRPLSPLSSDPNDMNPLTPAHFLIGRSLVALPDPNVLEIPDNRLSRYQRVQQLTQHFWTRWNKEYVAELQTRSKWKRNGASLIKKDLLVVVREDNLPPLKWQLGRIVELHPGSDGIIRVVTIKLANTTIKRPVAKICILPIETDCEKTVSEIISQ